MVSVTPLFFSSFIYMKTERNFMPWLWFSTDIKAVPAAIPQRRLRVSFDYFRNSSMTGTILLGLT